MEYSILFGEGAPADVTITTSGRADAGSFRQLNQALVSDPRFRPGMAVLVDHLALDVTDLRTRDLYELGRSVADLESCCAGSRLAVVVPEPLPLGAPADDQVRVFHSVDAALHWLRG
jgi:hypothetical protein